MLLTPGVWLAPGVAASAEPAASDLSPAEMDARTVPWSDVNRLALFGGVFPPAYRPVTGGELDDLLAGVENRALQGDAPALSDDAEFARLGWLRARFRGDGGVTWTGCPCKTHPPHVRVGGRVIGGYGGLGDVLPDEGGLGWPSGTNLHFEPTVEAAAGVFWAGAAWRVGGRVVDGGRSFVGTDGTDPLTWPGWPRATSRMDVRDQRLDNGAWRGRLTRAVVGARLGRWSLSAGWDHRRTGPGLTGDLNLDYEGLPFAGLTARRTAPFRWSGIMTHLAPDQTLLRVGQLSRRDVGFGDEFGRHDKFARPWFFQWLVGWNVTSWFRADATHTVMAVAREGTLWPDLLQINFPLIGTTWREQESGPVTDRIFSVQFEFRWREAPWPVFPSDAGRLFWNYGGTDFLPSGPGGIVPQISLPASVVGFELFSPAWDVGLEYSELWHDKAIWYTNGGYAEGYSHEQTLLGHALGGSSEAVTGLIRWRPGPRDLTWILRGQGARWGARGLTPGSGNRRTLGLSVRRTPAEGHSPLLWEVSVEWFREKVDLDAYRNFPSPDAFASRDWWRLSWKVGI